MKGLNWFQARALTRQGKAVRRDAWRRWITRGLVLYFTERLDGEGNALRYVVTADEFGALEFRANDWTDETWPDGPTPPTGTPSTPPSIPGTPGGTPGTPGTPGGPTGTPLPVGGGGWGGPDNPPGEPGPYAPSGGGGGGSPEGGPESPHEPPPHTPPAGQVPTVSVSIVSPDPSAFEDFSNGGNCFTGGSEDPRTIAELVVEVEIAGGPPGVGTLSVVLQGHTQLGTGWPGMSNAFDFHSINYLPGSTITATATYTISGTTYAGSGDYSFPTWCDGTCIPSSQNLTVALSGIHVNGGTGGDTYSGSPDGTYTLAWAGGYWETTFNAGSYTTDGGSTTTEVGWTLRVHCAGGIYTVGLGTDFPLSVGGFSLGTGGTGQPLNAPASNTFTGNPYAFIGGTATVRAVL